MSKYLGVTYIPEMPNGQRWKAEITIGRNKKLIGYFVDERTAALEYDMIAAQHGKPLNILKKHTHGT